jgi:hypothetical protein
MKLQVVESGEEIEAVIEVLDPKDFRQVAKSKGGFQFNWKKYKDQEIYKLRDRLNDKILGLICIQDHTDPETNAIEIELLEVIKENVGKNKKIERIAGCLVAFACRESFRRGHEGFLFLTPKTGLIDHYAEKYNMAYCPPIGNKLEGIMVAGPKVSLSLIKAYLE